MLLSYEDIFARHHRPVSYLNGGLELPVVRRPRTTLVFPSPVLHKDGRHPRPFSISSIDHVPRYVPPSPTTYRRLTPTSLTTETGKPFCPSPSSDIRYRPRTIPPRAGPSKTTYSSDKYRLTSNFADSPLRRREVPLCTPDDLLDIIREPTGHYELPTDPWNEVYPGIYLSDAPTALCTAVLKRIGVTHVLNAAQGKEKGCGQVNTTPSFYSQSGIKFLGVPAFDNIVFKLHPYFEEAAQFIEDGLHSGGKVLVHCRAGISRSATLVCAFLMLKRGQTVQEAVKAVRRNRAIIPNDGFLQQLCDLNDRLKRKSRL